MKMLNNIGSTLFLFAIFAGSVLSSGCQKVVDLTPSTQITDTEMKITAGIDLPNAAQTLASGIRDTEFNEGDQIGIYVVAYQKETEAGKLYNDGNYVDNSQTTKGAVGATPLWVSSPSIFYPNVDVDLYAYAPYSSSFKLSDKPDLLEFSVAADQTTTIATNDFMTAQALKKRATSAAIDLKFFHRLSKVDVKFTLPSTFKGKKISGLKSVSFKNFRSGAIINMTSPYTYSVDGSVSTGGSYPKPAVADAKSALININPNAVTAAVVATPAQYEAVVVPQSQAAGIGFVEIVAQYTDGKTETFNYISANAVDFKASHSTIINLTFQQDNALLLGTVDIQGWTPSAEITNPVNKHSNMIINCVAGSGTINKDAITATLTIEGKSVSATATYDDTNSCYRIKYDHGDNFGGYITKIVMRDAAVDIITATTTSGGLQIKGDPTLDSYNTPVGKLTFNATETLFEAIN